MKTFQSKMRLAAVFFIMATLVVSLFACGDSQGVATLNSCLSEFSGLIEDYKHTPANDKTKQAELDAKIEATRAKWTNFRNELGSEITPQDMDELVKKYDKLMSTLSNLKKHMGS